MRARFALDSRQCAQIGHQISHVCQAGLRIRCVRESGIIMIAGRRNAGQHGIGEIGQTPCADPVASMHGNIGRDENAERRFHLMPAA